MPLAHLLMLASEIHMGPVVYFMLGMGRIVLRAISRTFVLVDLLLIAGDLGFVRRDVLLMR